MIYLIQNDFTEFVKIGYSQDRDHVETRLKAIRTHCPGTAILLGCIPGSRQDEETLHTAYQTQRVSGEWFNLSNTDIDNILGTSKGDDYALQDTVVFPSLPTAPKFGCIGPTYLGWDEQTMLLRQRTTNLVADLLGCTEQNLSDEVKQKVGDFSKNFMSEVFRRSAYEMESGYIHEETIRFNNDYHRYAKEAKRYFKQLQALCQRQQELNKKDRPIRRDAPNMDQSEDLRECEMKREETDDPFQHRRYRTDCTKCANDK